VASVEEKRYIQGFGGKPEGKRPLERHRHSWGDNIKMDLKETGWECMNMDWIDLAQNRC
jgi:hypothetical protein